MGTTEPVRIYGAIVSGLTFIVGGLTTMFADNESVTLVLGIILLVLAGGNVVKDELVRKTVTPVATAAAVLQEARREPGTPGSGQTTRSPQPGDLSRLDRLDGIRPDPDTGSAGR